MAALVLMSAGGAEAQSSAPTARLEATITLPGRARCASDRALEVHAEPAGHQLALVGCVSAETGACVPTRVVLDDAATRELIALVAALETQPPCTPPAARSGDPRFTITTHGARGGTFAGRLPRVPAEIAAHTTGPCTAAARLAWFLAQHFDARSPS